jgi:hypothetical protein
MGTAAIVAAGTGNPSPADASTTELSTARASTTEASPADASTTELSTARASTTEVSAAAASTAEVSTVTRLRVGGKSGGRQNQRRTESTRNFQHNIPPHSNFGLRVATITVGVCSAQSD